MPVSVCFRTMDPGSVHSGGGSGVRAVAVRARRRAGHDAAILKLLLQGNRGVCPIPGHPGLPVAMTAIETREHVYLVVGQR